jgi:phosphonoacetaldehyde hydrolase
MGYTRVDAQAMKAAQPAEYETRLAQARRRLQEAGAHYVIDSVAGLPAVIEDIEARLKRGEAP